MNLKKELEILLSDDKLMPKAYGFGEVQELLKEALSKQKSEFIELLEGVRMEKKKDIYLNPLDNSLPHQAYVDFGFNGAVSEINKRLDKIINK